jgi:hypothetical protein
MPAWSKAMEFVWIELECGNNDADAAQLTLDLKNIHDSTSATVKLYTEPNRVKFRNPRLSHSTTYNRQLFGRNRKGFKRHESSMLHPLLLP